MFKRVHLEKDQPGTVQEVREFQVLAALENTEMEKAWETSGMVWQNQFLASLTDEGCHRWEKMLKIQPKLSDSLEARRFRIQSRINENLPCTYRFLLQFLEALCGPGNYKVVLQPGSYMLSVFLALEVKELLGEVQILLRRMVPVNLVLRVLLLYKQWQNYSSMRWQEVQGYTWQEMREEKI